MKGTERFATSIPEWNDWHWQISHRITDAQELSSWLPLSESEKADIMVVLKLFRMAVTPYYLSLIDPQDPHDPIRMQCIPSIQETIACRNDLRDPLNEDGASPVPHIVHRYPDRVLLLVTMECSGYCRHCTRRRIVGEHERSITDAELDVAIDYIKSRKEIRDVLISGGDPLTMATSRLEKIIMRLREIDHVDVIRIGTRVPVVMPMRIDEELLSMLKKYQPIWINTHFNHPKEITEYSEKACRMIVDAGIPLGNQTVLLKGINDTTDTIKELMLKLVHNRIRPYYLYQCDLSKGISHFRTRVETGIRIIHELQGFISGFAIPKFVIDAPGGGGKIPISYNYVLSNSDREYILENYEGDKYTYPQP